MVRSSNTCFFDLSSMSVPGNISVGVVRLRCLLGIHPAALSGPRPSIVRFVLRPHALDPYEEFTSDRQLTVHVRYVIAIGGQGSSLDSEGRWKAFLSLSPRRDLPATGSKLVVVMLLLRENGLRGGTSS